MLAHSSNDLYGASKILLNIIELLINEGYKVYLFLPETGPLHENNIIKKCNINIIEFGVWRGHMTKRMATVVKNSDSNKRIFACDSFEGFGEDTITAQDTSLFRTIAKLKKKFTAANDVPRKLDEFFNHFDLNGTIVKGFFRESVWKIDSTVKYCFAHVDCDAYKSHLDCLDYVYDRMVKGGCIVFDDYDKKLWPGATKAVDEFLSDKEEKIKLSDQKENPAWYIIKS